METPAGKTMAKARAKALARRTSLRLPLAWAVGIAALPALVSTASAGELRGQIKFDGQFGEAPKRNKGFIGRIANPIRPVQQFKPHGYLIVVLEGGPEEEGEQSPPRRVNYDLVGESFEVPILPVIVKTTVEVENKRHTAVTLSAPDYPDLVDNLTLDPKKSFPLKVESAYEVIVIKAPGMPHPEGRVVAFPTKYFARVDRRGRFTIKDVPEGTWKVRLWYLDGWVEGVEESVSVSKKRGEVTLKVKTKQIPKPGGK